MAFFAVICPKYRLTTGFPYSIIYLPNSRQVIQLDTKQALIAIALKAFLERGYDHVPLREIADAAGIKQASIYYHFTDKHALLEACAQSFFEKWYQWMDDPTLKDADLKSMFKGIANTLGMDSLLIRQLYDAQTESGQYRFLLDILTHCPQQMTHMHEFNNAFYALLVKKTEEAKQSGAVPANVSPRSVYILLSALVEGCNILHFTDPDIDCRREAPQLFDLLWEGIRNAR